MKIFCCFAIGMLSVLPRCVLASENGWFSIGMNCVNLEGRFSNAPTAPNGELFAYSQTMRSVEYIEIKYLPQETALLVNMFDSNQVLIEMAKWKNYVCIDNQFVRSGVIHMKGGEAGAFHDASRIDEVGINSEGELLVKLDYQIKRTIFGLFGRENKVINVLTYPKIKNK